MAGILNRILGRAKPETRAGGYVPGFSIGGYGGPFAASTPEPHQAENLSTVTACVNAIASGLASLPARVYQAQGDGRIEAPGHPVSRIVRAPNQRQTWPDLIEWIIGQVLLRGNALCEVVYDGAGRPTAMLPIQWQYVRVVVLPSGRLAYDVIAYTAPWGGSGQPRRLLASEAFHLRDRSDDGYLGRSRLSRAPDVLNSAIGLQTFSAAVWDNAATPNMAVTLPPGANAETIKRMESHFTGRNVGAANARRTLFLDHQSTATAMSVSPEDAEVLASRQFSVTELCRLFGVPPPLVQDYSNNTFTNAATAELWFASRTLLPWAKKLEAEFARSLFVDPSFSLEIDLSGLQRGDYATRWAANVAAVTAGILTRDEVREQEGYQPMPAGDVLAATPQPAPVDPLAGAAGAGLNTAL